MLKWARANGCPWNEFTCECAAENGHLEVLKWARANGCPWDADTCANAEEILPSSIIEYLQMEVVDGSMSPPRGIE